MLKGYHIDESRNKNPHTKIIHKTRVMLVTSVDIFMTTISHKNVEKIYKFVNL